MVLSIFSNRNEIRHTKHERYTTHSRHTSAKKLILTALLFALSLPMFSLNVPQLKGHVNDYANIINGHEEQQIEKYLTDLENTTGIQLAVLTIPTLKGEDLASFAIKTAETWKLGQEGKDNGALLLVAYQERQVRIETGYGLEDKLTDAKCGRIIRNVIIPEFKDGDYSQGILKGIMNMGGIASDNQELISKSVAQDYDDDEGAVEGILFLAIWVIFVFVIISSRGGLFKWLFLSRLFGSSYPRKGGFSGSYRGGSSFGRSFGGSSFGGSSFHGGGGHFGGGGASGHW